MAEISRRIEMHLGKIKHLVAEALPRILRVHRTRVTFAVTDQDFIHLVDFVTP